MELSARLAEAMKIIEASPRGISAADVAKRLGITAEHTTTAVLRPLRKLGLAQPVTHGSGAVWAPAERVPYLLKMHKERVRKRELQRKRAAEKRRRERQAEREDADTWADTVRPVIIIKAGSVPPPFTTGARSVFSLAL